MSLDYDVREVPEDAKTDGNEWAITNAMIWATMSLGINHVKDETTADEFHTRWMAWARVWGPPVSRATDGGQFEAFTPSLAEVRRRIGLRTNATPMTAAGFGRRLAAELMREARHATEKEARALVVAAKAVS